MLSLNFYISQILYLILKLEILESIHKIHHSKKAAREGGSAKMHSRWNTQGADSFPLPPFHEALWGQVVFS